VAGLWDSAGLEADELAGAYRGSYIDICPPSLQLPLPQRPLHRYAVRPIEAPPQAAHVRDRPIVYATLGTVFNELATFKLLLEALATIECDVVMTIGHNRAPADLEPIPDNATIASYIPQAEILHGCDAVIAHGGSGSFLAALAHGRPLVLLPKGADQFDNARACAGLGVAEVFLPSEVTVEAIHEGVTNILTNPAYSENARSIATEIAAMPPPAATADDLAHTINSTA
jgi:MGT family glycosyltransferase